MAYYINLFSPDTYHAFHISNHSVCGFRERHKGAIAKIKPGDRLICYMTKLSRWVGVLEILSEPFIDDTALFIHPVDPFVVRFRVRPVVWLAAEYTVPIGADICWNHLSFTEGYEKNSQNWKGMIRGTLRRLNDDDGRYLETLLCRQRTSPLPYPLNTADQKKFKHSLIKTRNSQVTVSVPENDSMSAAPVRQQRQSIRMQALLAEIGERMHLKIWLPRSDRQRVLDIWRPKSPDCLLSQLPLNYDNVTLGTIENIDVLWIHGRSIIRAFEVEHTTSIYSGILRMADLMALQPNLSIRAHIVAPEERRAKVFGEITRPVFALLESGPLAETCTYISYEAVRVLSKEKQLEYMRDSVLEAYEQYAEDTDV